MEDLNLGLFFLEALLVGSGAVLLICSLGLVIPRVTKAVDEYFEPVRLGEAYFADLDDEMPIVTVIAIAYHLERERIMKQRRKVFFGRDRRATSPWQMQGLNQGMTEGGTWKTEN